MVGIVCGTYSSVCITGALWYVLRTKIKRHKKIGIRSFFLIFGAAASMLRPFRFQNG